jgi:hypothetical protein
MAIKNLFASSKAQWKIVSSKDEALAADFSRDEYNEYLKNLDESLLRRRPDCEEAFTYFHFKQSTTIKEAIKKKNKIANLGMKMKDASGDQPLFETLVALVESSLCDITCEGVSYFKASEDGSPSEELLFGLLENEILIDLANAIQVRQFGSQNQDSLELTKKN